MWLLRTHTLLFAALRVGIKDTWRNVFSRLDEVFGELPCAFAALVRSEDRLESLGFLIQY